MSRIVVDTDIASYIFNWHSSAKYYVDALRGSELVLCFMSIAEMRMGAFAAGWGVRRTTLLEQFIQGFGVSALTTPCAPPGRGSVRTRAPPAAR